MAMQLRPGQGRKGALLGASRVLGGNEQTSYDINLHQQGTEWTQVILIVLRYLVGGLNQLETYESQLGWWHSPYKKKTIPNHQPAIYIPLPEG